MVQNSAQNVVERLIRPISKTSRNVTCDNWFTSFGLIESLRRNHQLTFVGTVRKNKRELPTEFVNTKNRPVFSSMFGFSKDVTIVSYIPKQGKNVILTSSMHHDDKIDIESGDKCKPDIITFYNSTKGGVDTVDQYCSNYDVARNTRRWPMVIFYSLLNIGAINSYIIYLQNNSTEEIFRREYLKRLSFSLTENHLQRRSNLKNLPPAIRERRAEVAGTTSECPKGDLCDTDVRKRCYFCVKQSKTRYFCEICKKFLCLKHCHFRCVNCQ